MSQDLLQVAVMSANAVFTAFRIAAHVPQLIAVVRDPCGARAISVPSWVLFGIANLSNAIYALVMAGDFVMLGINLVSALSCAAIAAVACVKQRRFAAIERARGAGDPSAAFYSGAERPTRSGESIGIRVRRYLAHRASSGAPVRYVTTRAMPNAVAAAKPPMVNV